MQKNVKTSSVNGAHHEMKPGPKAPPASAPHQVQTDVRHKDCPDTVRTRMACCTTKMVSATEMTNERHETL